MESHYSMGYHSDKKKGGDESFNTVECLRGRLLAERQASKVANEEAESICNKLIELEKKLREEIKLRERAERRLKFLKKKLASFNISGESSQKCQNCCTTPTTRQTKPHTTNPRFSDGSMHKFSEDCDTQGEPYCHFPQNLCEKSDPNSEYLKSDESRLSISSSKSSTEDSIALSTDDYSSNSTNPGDSSLEYHTHNPNPSSNNVKNEESSVVGSKS